MGNSNFTFFETVLIKNELPNKSFKDIASILNRSLEDVAEYATEVAKSEGITPYGGNPSREKNKPLMVKPENKQAIIISRHIEERQVENRRKSREPQYQTKPFNPSELVAVKVDEKTIIYIKASDDATEARKKCLERLNRFKQNAYSPKSIVRKNNTSSAGYFEQKRKLTQ
jgi:hypothetical protein